MQVIGADCDGIGEQLYMYFDGEVLAGSWPAAWFSLKATPPQDFDSAAGFQSGGSAAIVNLIGQGGLSTGSPRGVYNGPTGGIVADDGRQLPHGFEFPVNML